MSEQEEVLNRLIRGFYSVGEVRRLTGVAERVSRRFAKSYKGNHGLWGGQDQRLGRFMYITFRDLIELRYVNAFHTVGVSWQRIVKTAQYAQSRFESEYPFSDLRFKTDGEHIFGQSGEGLEQIYGRGQMAFAEVIGEYLFEPLDYLENEPVRWYPAEEWGMDEIGREVMVDPRFGFGAPVITEYHIPTETLYLNYKAELDNAKLVARSYDIPVESVRIAVAFQEEFATRHSPAKA